MADANVGALVATTLRNRRKSLADNVTVNNALLDRMDKKGQLKEVAQGGRTIFEPLIHGSNSSVQFYDGYDTFTPPTVTQETIDGSEWNWKQLGGFVAISGREQVMNSGKAQVVDLVEARIKQLQAQLRNTASTSLYSDGTGSSGKEFGGLRLIVADDPTAAGTVGGINQVTNTFWRNYFSAAAATTSATVTARMNAAWLNTIRGTDKVDLILADDDMFTYYWTSLQANARFTDPKSADAGFTSLKYMSADVVYDDACPDKHMYFLNTDSLAFRYAPNRWFEVGDAQKVLNADYSVTPVWVMGNLTCNNRALNGVVIAS
jgi:hypothetical protein